MSIPNLDEQFLPRLVSVFYAIFHPTEGPKVVYQVPEGSITQDTPPSSAGPATAADGASSASSNPAASSKGATPNPPSNIPGSEPLFHFSALSEYLIPKAPLCGRLVTCIARSLSTNAPEQRPGLDKRSQSSHSLSSRTSSNPAFDNKARAAARTSRSYKILGFPVLIENASRYRRNNFIFNMCFVFDGHADVRTYEPIVRKCGRTLRSMEEDQSFLSNPKSLPRVHAIIEQLFEDLNSYCESFVALPEAPYTSYIQDISPKGQDRLASPFLGPSDLISLGASAASLRDEHHKRLLAQHQQHLRHAHSPGQNSSPTSPLRSATLRRSSTASHGPSHSFAGSPGSPSSKLASRPTIERSATLSSVMEATSPSKASPSAVDTFAWPSSLLLSKAASQGRMPSQSRKASAERQSELSKDLAWMPSTSDSNLSRTATGDGDPMAESTVSLASIEAALSSSLHQLKSPDDTGGSTKAGIAQKREPPHGLGRTVRDAINLKLFPTYANPAPVNDWDVPVALLDLGSRVDDNWDLTMARIFPFIDGVNHVKRIAQLADADLGLTRSCMEHLLYYGCIIMIDIFQYFNMYTLRPAIARMADDDAMGRECATYVTRPGYPLASYPELLRLYSLLRPGKNLHDWIEENEIDAKGIDVRRFVSFGVIQGFLRRVHRYPVYLDPNGPAVDECESQSRLDASMISTARNSPMFRSSDSPSRTYLDESGSRESRDGRPRDSISRGSLLRGAREGSVEWGSAGGGGGSSRTVQGQRPRSLGPGAGAGALDSGISRADTSGALSTSPTKRLLPRARQRQAYRHPTATVMEVATVAFEAGDGEKRGEGPGRSPRKRTQSGWNLAGQSGFASDRMGTAGASGISQSQRSIMTIPVDLAEMADGTRCDDELCVMYGVGWPDLERMLVQLGTSTSGIGGGGGGELESGWSRIKMSGPSRSGGGAAGTGTGSSGFAGQYYSSGWGMDSEGGTAGWSGIERQAVEGGDLGRVKVLLQ